MQQKDLFLILQKIIIFLILSFVIFIIAINLKKVADFIIKIENVLKATEDENIEMHPIDSEFYDISLDSTKDINKNQAYTAKKLGYVDALPNLNGSEWGEGLNILLVGSDNANYKNSKARSDVIIVLRINSNGKILSISIPRDTLVEIRDGEWAGANDKIGHSLYWDGMDNLKKSVEDLLGSPVYKIAIIDNFRNFEAFLAIIGGLEIDKSLQGGLGIQWIRNRNFRDGDIERCKRQQLFMKKAVTKIWQITRKGNYIYSNFMYQALKKIVHTDLTKEDFLNILYNLKANNFNPEKDFLTGVLPGEFGKYDSVLLQRNNLDCWVLNEDIIKKLQFLFYSENNSYKMFTKRKVTFWNFLKIDLKFQLKNDRK